MTAFGCVQAFDADLFDELASVYRRMRPDDRSVFNDPAFLRECWTAAESQQRLGYIYRTKGHVAGAAFFGRERVRISGMRRRWTLPIGYRVAEFTKFIVAPGEERRFWEGLIRRLRTDGEMVLLPNVRKEDVGVMPPESLTLFCHSQVINPVCSHSERSFADIVKRKSLVRNTKWFERRGRFEVVHRTSGMDRRDLDQVVQLHAERWGMVDVASKFSDQRIRIAYELLLQGLAENAQEGNGIVLTSVLYNDEPIAVHVGFRWGNRFLCQVPVMNPKYLVRSPGTVLMRSLFQYCLDEGLTCFDLGYGEEGYKKQYATEHLVYRTYVAAPSLSWGVAAHAARRIGASVALRRIAGWPHKLRSVCCRKVSSSVKDGGV